MDNTIRLHAQRSLTITADAVSSGSYCEIKPDGSPGAPTFIDAGEESVIYASLKTRVFRITSTQGQLATTFAQGLPGDTVGLADVANSGQAADLIGLDTILSASLLTLTVRIGTGVPTGAPNGTELPIAYDSTAVTGGAYAWTGSAWVKISPVAA